MKVSNENEVEKARDMGDWKRVIEILEMGRGGKQVSSSPSDILANFLQSEANLEIWLDEHQPPEKFITKAKSSLIDVKKSLQLVLSHAGDQSGLKTDVRVLLAKVYFASGLLEEALDELEKSGIMGVSENGISVRNIQLMAEAHSIKAHSLEKVGKSLRGKHIMSEAERKKEILRCYNRGADLAIQFFQGQEKLFAAAHPTISSGGTISPHPQNWEKRRPISILDTTIRKGPNLLLEEGKMEEAILRIQKLLRSCDTHYFTNIRLVLYRRLAELGLRYKFLMSKLSATEASGTYVKFNSSSGVFTPQNLWENIILALLLGESLVVKEGVLSQAPEFEKARKLANANAAATYDLLCLAMSRWGQYQLLNDAFEQALKFSFGESHIWSQYGLTFVAAGVSSRKANQTLVEAASLSKKPTTLLLLAAQQAFTRLQLDNGMEFVKMAKESELSGSKKLLSRALLYEGIGYFLKSFEKHIKDQRQHDRELALKAFVSAVELDPDDWLALHWLARIYAWMQCVSDALEMAIRVIRVYRFHLPTLQLIILLMSAERNYTDALAVTEESLEEYPDHLGFLQIKAVLDQKLLGPDIALSTIRQMLVVWKRLFDDGSLQSRSDTPPDRKPFSGGLLPLSPTDRDYGGPSSVASFRAPSIAPSSTNTGTLTAGFRADAALSEIGSSASVSGVLKAGSGDLSCAAQINIWIMLTDVYLKLNQPNQAAQSIEEAAQIASAHPDVLYYRGQIEEHLEHYMEAKTWYESVLGIRPTHVKALQSLALMQHYFGSHLLSEKTLQDALKLDPYDHYAWYNLGKVLEALGECAEAADCMATALELEATNPILPYSIIPICFE